MDHLVLTIFIFLFFAYNVIENFEKFLKGHKTLCLHYFVFLMKFWMVM